MEAFVFSRRSSFAWLTCGGESGVDEFSEAGEADLVITEDKAYVLAPNNEIDRLAAEVLPGQGYEAATYSWRDNRIAALQKLLGRRTAGSDLAIPGCTELYNQVKELRYALLPEEQSRITSLGQTAAATVGAVCKDIRPGDSEVKIAGEIKGRLGAEGIHVPVALVAADERVDRFRHPLPTDKKVKKRVMVVVCARRQGLTVALTRLVYFGAIPGQVRERLELVCTINARMISATVPGKKIGDIFQETVRAYADAGFAYEWENHHQGGAIGYANREYIAFPECTGTVLENQAFAWNPMIVNVKSEETFITSAGEAKIITHDPGWPCRLYAWGDISVPLPEILVI